MMEFLEQFLLESRELIEQATADLIALEKAPSDRERLDSAFRSFHTLKGGAGIVDFDAMQRAVHAAEDVLATAHSGARALTTALIGDCLECLDQVSRWLDAMQATGERPEGADEDSRRIVERLSSATGGAAKGAERAAAPVDANWAEALLRRYTSVQAQAKTAMRYTPDADAFFRGEDPLARIAALPGLLAVALDAAEQWPPLATLDPFKCNLVIGALTQDPAESVAAVLGDAADHCAIQSLEIFGSGGSATLPPQAREIVNAQVMLLAEAGNNAVEGTMVSAAIVAANVFRRMGRTAVADEIARVAEASQAGNGWRALRSAIETAAAGAISVRGTQPARGMNEAARIRTLRVDAFRIESLVKLAGELTVAKNAVGHLAKLAQQNGESLASALKSRHAVLDRLVGELQQAVLAMHVLPLRVVFQRFPRLLREMAGSLGKPASLTIEGEETEADKAIVELLFEPLLHLVRNSIDHGIEDAATRAANGKPAVAAISLRARRERDRLIVEVGDDGAGVNLDKVRAVALERGLATEALLTAMNEREVVDLIFAPGFSTASQVTGLSGRGVGMDAVRNAVHRMGGQVDIRSDPGKGMTVRVSLAFSIMMMHIMTVTIGDQLFGIPLDQVVESVRIRAEEVVPVGTAMAVVLRNQTIPLLELTDLLGADRRSRDGAEATIVVARVDNQLAAIRVDRLGDRMEIMLKPLEGLLAGMRGIAGSTMLGDGSVLLVLNLVELVS
jgi:two-component system chemotaxis sensor kinase CheA